MAHTPIPLNAMRILAAPDITTATMVALNRPLNSIFLDT